MERRNQSQSRPCSEAKSLKDHFKDSSDFLDLADEVLDFSAGPPKVFLCISCSHVKVYHNELFIWN